MRHALQGRGIDVVALGRARLDVTRREAVETVFAEVEPQVVVHCAAYTAVDEAESDRDRAFRVNESGTGHVAEAAQANGAHLVAVSTDFVFDGASERPYRPDDPTGPLSVYGASKWAGELAALQAAPGATLVRTSALFGPGGRDFVDVMLRRGAAGLPLRVVADQITQPTYAPSLAQVLIDLGLERAAGVWHASDVGPVSWHDFAVTILGDAGIDADIVPVTTEEWAAPAARPLYSVLDVSDTERRLGRALPAWRETLSYHLGSEEGG